MPKGMYSGTYRYAANRDRCADLLHILETQGVRAVARRIRRSVVQTRRQLGILRRIRYIEETTGQTPHWVRASKRIGTNAPPLMVLATAHDKPQELGACVELDDQETSLSEGEHATGCMVEESTSEKPETITKDTSSSSSIDHGSSTVEQSPTPLPESTPGNPPLQDETMDSLILTLLPENTEIASVPGMLKDSGFIAHDTSSTTKVQDTKALSSDGVRCIAQRCYPAF